MKSEHDREVFLAVVKGAMERGIDVPKIIAEQLRKYQNCRHKFVDSTTCLKCGWDSAAVRQVGEGERP